VSAAPQILDPRHPPARLALAYSTAADRPLWSSYFALEARLAETGRRTSQPMMTQLRLAWWRDRLSTPASDWPQGEPLLAALVPWDRERGALVALVDGWEALLVGDDAGRALAEARICIMVALARLLGIDAAPGIEAAARVWLAPEGAMSASPLPRSMRPLAVLRLLAVRDAARQDGATGPFGDAFALLRLALIGR
jgi:phytoene synthase